MSGPEAPIQTPVPRATARKRPSRMPHEVRARRRRLVGYGLVVLSGILMVNALVGDRGYLAQLSARQEQAALQEQINRLKLENRQIEEQIQRLQHDPDAIEAAARQYYHLIKPGEMLVIVKGDSAAPKGPSSPR